MPRISAIRVVDRAILPSVILIATKILGIFVGSILFNIAWKTNFAGSENNFLILQFNSEEDLSTLVNFSDTLTMLACGIGFSWALFQANHLNIDTTHPTLISKLYSKGKEFWLTTTGSIYHTATVWLVLSWLILFFILVNVYQGLSSKFVLGMSLAITVALTFAYYKFVNRN